MIAAHHLTHAEEIAQWQGVLMAAVEIRQNNMTAEQVQQMASDRLAALRGLEGLRTPASGNGNHR